MKTRKYDCGKDEKMETEKMITGEVDTLRLEVNDDGEYIMISADDATMFDRFVAGIRHIVELSDETAKKVEEVEKQYEGQTGFEADMKKVAAISGINVEFSKEAVRTVDSIFGEGTVKKVFRSTYNDIPDFLPSVNLITEFFEQVTPYMEKLFNRKLEAQKKASKARMDKYRPQDHKPPQRR